MPSQAELGDSLRSRLEISNASPLQCCGFRMEDFQQKMDVLCNAAECKGIHLKEIYRPDYP